MEGLCGSFLHVLASAALSYLVCFVMHLTRFPTFLVTVPLVDICKPVKHGIISLLFPFKLSLVIITLLLLCTPLPNPSVLTKASISLFIRKALLF